MSTHTPISLWTHIPLTQAFFCQDCNAIGNNEQACPACASQSLLPLAGVLNRKEMPRAESVGRAVRGRSAGM